MMASMTASMPAFIFASGNLARQRSHRLRRAALGVNNSTDPEVASQGKITMTLRIVPVPGFVIAAAAALVLAGCTTTPTAEVTRFHLSQPMPSDTIRVVASPDQAAPGTAVPLEFRTYAAIVSRDLAVHGFRPIEAGPAAYVAVLDVQQTTQAGNPSPPPFRIGIGGGGIGGGGGGGGIGGIGGGISVPVGRSRNNDVRVNVLSLRIRRQSDESAVWEGRAVQQIPASAQGSNLSAAVPALSGALLKEFPGISGQTVTVKLR